MDEKKDNDAPRWYSIKEAAKYLSIGEPTLYRWMRDGKITYRKIGDSTRFTRPDLDAFVQVFPSTKELDEAKEICPICHHDELVDGVFRTTGLNYFAPKKTKFWSFLDGSIKTNAKMCTRCGGITHYGDVKKLNSLKNSEKKTDDSE